MSSSRAKAMKWNMLTGWAQELFTLLSGLILPRLVLGAFGSEANGLVNSIAQYLGFSVVLRAGLGGVTRAALYKPLAEGDMEQVSSIMVATQSFMRKVALILVGYVAVIALVYPSIAKGSYDWGYMFLMVLIVGSNSVVENLLGVQAKILLQADQKYYIQTLCSLLSQVVAFVVSVVMIKLGASLMVMKIAVALCACTNRVFLHLYVKKRYRLNMKAKPNNLALKQRWDAFAQQMAVVVNDNIDLFLLTIFVSLKEISVYTIHNMVAYNIRKLVEACVTGLNSMFGDMMAKKEQEALKSTFRFVEWAFFAVCVIIFSVTAIMLTPFIRLYTSGITDVNYIRPVFAVTITLVSMMGCMRKPYQMVVEAAGHFKQTRNGAIMEVVVNIVVSIVMLKLFGIIGVLIGTFAAAMIRTLQYAFYSYKHILNLSRWMLLRTYGIYMLAFVLIVAGALAFGLPVPTGWLAWCGYSVLAVLWAVAVVLVVTLINDRSQMMMAIRKLKKKLERK